MSALTVWRKKAAWFAIAIWPMICDSERDLAGLLEILESAANRALSNGLANGQIDSNRLKRYGDFCRGIHWTLQKVDKALWSSGQVNSNSTRTIGPDQMKFLAIGFHSTRSIRVLL